MRLKTKRHFICYLAFLGMLLLPLFLNEAKAAINPIINFQGKLTNSDGTNVADNSYSVVFTIYDGGNESGGGSSVWSETQTVPTYDGIFRVSLGSVTTLPGSVNFNNYPLYLSVKVGADSEMLPRILLTSSPYSFNSELLDGIDSSGFIQLAPSAAQVDSSTANSVYINKTGASGSILSLQKSGIDVFNVANSGAVTVAQLFTGQAGASITGGSLTLTGNAASSLTTSSGALTVTSAAAATWSTTAGNLTLQAGSGTVSFGTSTSLVASGGLTLTTAAGNSLTLTSPTAATWSTTAGNLTLQAGSGTVSLGTSTNLTASGALNISAAGGNSLTLTSPTAATWSTTAGALTITSAATATWSTTAGNLTLQAGSGTVSLGTSTILTASGAINITTGSGNLQIGTSDTTGTLLVLDAKTNAGDPSGVNGGMYYNSNDTHMRCYENGYWSDCSTTRLLGETTLSAAASSISITLATSTEYLECHLDIKGRSTSSMPYLRFNNASGGTNYGWNITGIIATSTTDWQDSSDSEIQLSGTNPGSNPFSATIFVTNFADTYKVVNWQAAGVENAGTNSNVYMGVGGYYNNSSQISSVQFIASGGTFNSGSHAWCEGRDVR